MRQEITGGVSFAMLPQTGNGVSLKGASALQVQSAA